MNVMGFHVTVTLDLMSLPLHTLGDLVVPLHPLLLGKNPGDAVDEVQVSVELGRHWLHLFDICDLEGQLTQDHNQLIQIHTVTQTQEHTTQEIPASSPEILHDTAEYYAWSRKLLRFLV